MQDAARTGEKNTYQNIEVKITRTFVKSSAGGRTMLQYLRQTDGVGINWITGAQNGFNLRILYTQKLTLMFKNQEIILWTPNVNIVPRNWLCYLCELSSSFKISHHKSLTRHGYSHSF